MRTEQATTATPATVMGLLAAADAVPGCPHLHFNDRDQYDRAVELLDAIGWIQAEHVWVSDPAPGEEAFEAIEVHPSGEEFQYVTLTSPAGYRPVTTMLAASLSAPLPDYVEGHRIISGNDPGDENDYSNVRRLPVERLGDLEPAA